jgi:hypothetical protein
VSSQAGKPSAAGATPSKAAASCGIGWTTPGKDSMLTWDKLLDLAVDAYWQRRPAQERSPARTVRRAG